MLIVSDTSPITNLIKVGQLHLLRQLFGEIVIPKKVFEELIIYEKNSEALAENNWISVKLVKDQKLVTFLEKQIDSGEAEAIILAKELAATLIILDDRKGRNVAEAYGLKIIGLVGVLIQAKRKGYIENLKPILDLLIMEVGFRVSEELYRKILSEVSEEGL